MGFHASLERRRPSRAAAALIVGLAVLVAGPVPLAARPVRPLAGPPIQPEERPSFLVTGLSSSSSYDTSWYGGTVWAADSNRWEAIPGGMWTFESGVGSWIQPPGDPYDKPAGYHRLMEGWGGREMLHTVETSFRRLTTCAISGSFSMWIGLTTPEADSAGWCDGQGYGNSWSTALTRTFAYPGTGDVTFQYQYAVDSEPSFDYLIVSVLPSGAADEVVLRTYDGAVQGTESLVLRQADGTLPAGPGSITLTFLASSDGSYSDEDCLYRSTCGLAAIDNIALTGAISHAADFESGPDGWESQPVSTAATEYSDLRDAASLPPVNGFYCTDCGLRDSVLVFLDPNGVHPPDQWDPVFSPWIDLRAGQDVNRAGRILEMNLWAMSGVSPPIAIGWQYYPYASPYTGTIGVSPWMYSSVSFYGASVCGRYRYNLYGVPPGAEQVRIALGTVGYPSGSTDPFPYIDNVRVGAYGPNSAPSLAANDRLQDNFAADGTLDPRAPGRVDSSRRNGSTLADTLVVYANGANVETRIVFHVRPGPFTDAAALALAATRWTPETGLGAGWYSARMDTAERGGLGTSGAYMSAFHESDPGFLGHDTDSDPSDPGHLANDIFPDNLFTPGSRIDYFAMARYIPPDPRNPGGQSWFVMPDTTGGSFWEMEILPSSMATDSSANCVLLIDAHDWESPSEHRLEENALIFALGPGGGNAEETRFDRYDCSSRFESLFGRPAGANYGATQAQAGAYQQILWSSGSTGLTPPAATDVAILDPWLTGGASRGFWGNGLDLANRMHQDGGTARAFLNGALGTGFLCTAARNAACPSGTIEDSTGCLPLTGVDGAAFGTSGATSLRGNGCPDLRGFDVLLPAPTVTTAAGNLSYVKGGAVANYGSVTNEVIGGSSWRSVMDGFPVADLRRTPADPHAPGECSGITAVYERTLDVLTWLSTPDCPVTAVSGLPEPPAGPAPQPRLGDASPNPMRSSARIGFTTAAAGAPIELQIFDVAGRRVRCFRPAGLPAGDHELTWDGRSDAGSRVPAGLYFYRLSMSGFLQTKKLVVLE